MEFGDFDDIVDASIFKATVTRSTKSRLPLILPWHPKQTIKIGTLFNSQNLDDPWMKESPFTEYSLVTTPLVVYREDGTDASFNSKSTSSTSSTHDHLSLGFGIGVGLPFLASVTVSGTYDKDVTENKDADKTSIRSSVRAGAVVFGRQPRLTTEAIITVKYDGGVPAFHSKYGDYYVSGYRLGGDTQMMLSGSGNMKKELERFGVKVTVEVLFVEASTSYSKDFETNSSQRSLNLTGYDTVGYQKWNASMNGTVGSALELQNQAAQIVEASQSLDLRIDDKLNEIGIEDGDHLDSEICRRLTEAGLVVELVLLPVETLREVIEWTIEDDII